MSLLLVASSAFAEPAASTALIAGDGLKAHRIVRAWVDQGQVDTPSAPHLPPHANLMGVRITLRMRGQTVGAGQALGADAPLLTLLGQATRQALGQVRQKLTGATFKSVLAGRANPDDAPPTVADVADQLLIDVQIAHDRQPIQLPRAAPPGALYETFAPGYHGLVALTPDGRDGKLIWPATVLAGNVSPVSQVTAALAQAGYTPTQVAGKAGRPNGPALHRFEVLHVVRATLDTLPRQLIRGNVLLPARGLNDAQVRTLADRLASRLTDQFVSQGKMRGTYHPSTNRYDPKLAPAQQIALAAYALTRYEQAQTLAQRTIAVPNTPVRALALAQVQKTPPGQLSAAVGALTLMMLCDAPENEALGQAIKPLTDRLLAMQKDPGQYRDHEAEDAPLANLTTQALIASALASAYAHNREPAVGQAAIVLLDQVWATTTQRPGIGALYWQTLAHSRLTEQLAITADASAQLRARQRTQGLAQLADQLLLQQVVEKPTLGPGDVTGGFVLRPGLPGSAPNPDWRTAPVLAFLAAAARHPDLTQGRQPLDWLLSCSLAGRFLAQLTMEPSSCYYVRSLDEARDGVRLALFDNTLSPSALAMTLIALTELQRSVLTLAQ